MTKEQVIKHKSVIEWWLSNLDKGVWRKDTPTNDWYLDLEPTFYEDFTYVKNDEYSKFRKAIVENKQIQAKYHPTGEIAKWVNIDLIKLLDSLKYDNLTMEDCDYKDLRIKIEEPKFKVGDWVVGTESGKITKVKEYHMQSDIFRAYHKLWKPQVGELIVFADDEKQEYYIRKFTDDDVWTDNIAPLDFVNTLKD